MALDAEEKIDNPVTVEDYRLAARAWLGGYRSHWNSYAQSGPDGSTPPDAEAQCKTADVMTALTYALLAQVPEGGS